ncbi:MAG: sugar transferase [Candidatus Yanofskybacteria bacterium]|nr:sugar transferase [Candidatus Yanofskybacteria bacterium]
MKKADLFFNVLRLPVDFVMLLVAGLTTYLLRTKILAAFRPVLFEFNLPLVKYIYLVLAVSFIFLLAYAASGLYSMKTRMKRFEEFAKILVASSAAILAVIIYIFLSQELFNSRFLVLGGWFFAILFVSVGRLVVRWLQNIFVAKYDFGIHRVMIVGDDETTQKIIDDIRSNPQSGYRVAKHLTDPELAEVRAAVENPGVDEVILTNTNYPASKVVELVDFCNENHLVFKFIPNIYQTLTTNFDIDSINGLPLIELKRTALDGWGRVAKRVLDIIGSVGGLLILSPVFAVVAFAIKWETAGPVFVRLRRISRKREFSLIKFRSMVRNAEELKPALAVLNERQDGPLFKIKNDPRITGVGKSIRKYRIDELPQLWNVLRGDMSLIGPRPHQPDEIERYEKHHKRVLSIKAGATGIAQVSGSSDLVFEQEVALDTYYIEHWSIWMDLKIILKTLFKMFTDKSAV